ncbi:MAG: OmpH family outer membrane protein [Candidatus Omnitrophota bacterium]
MKRSGVIGLVVALSLFFMTTLVYAEAKLGYVDLGKVFDEYKKTKEYDKVLEGKQKDYEKEREGKIGEVKELQDKLGMLSEAERDSRKGELEDKITKLQEFDRNLTQDLRKQRDERVQEIFKDIKDSIDSYAKKEGLTFVFDSRALVFYNEKLKLDITDQILKFINNK